jgi:hypothetical protein
LTLRSAAFNPGLYVYDGVTGDFIDYMDNVGVGNSATVSLPTCRSGPDPILMLTNSFAGGETGPYTLTVALQGSAALRAAESTRETLRPTPVLSGADVARLMKMTATFRKRR